MWCETAAVKRPAPNQMEFFESSNAKMSTSFNFKIVKETQTRSLSNLPQIAPITLTVSAVAHQKPYVLCQNRGVPSKGTQNQIPMPEPSKKVAKSKQRTKSLKQATISSQHANQSGQSKAKEQSKQPGEGKVW